MEPLLSACVINHKTPDLTAACLRSLQAERERAGNTLPLEILLANNTPDDADTLAALCAEVGATLLQNEQPLGFAANQNRLMRRARGRYLLPLNSDTTVTPGALAALVDFMAAHPACGVAGPRLVHPDCTLQRSCRSFPTAATHFLEASGLWSVLARSGPLGRRLGEHNYLLSAHDRPRPVDWLSAAALIVRREVLDRGGLFDEVHFAGMYGEDIDWCYRLHRAGWEIWFTPAAVIVHHESASPLDGRSVQVYRGFYRFCALHYPPGRQRRIRAATWLALAPRRLLTADPARRSLYRQLMALPVQ